MKLIIDDIRSCEMCFNTSKNEMFLNSDWVIVKNYQDFISLIDKVGINKISIISFDHDLSDFEVIDDIKVEFTGKTACEYIIEKCLDSGTKFPDWYVHTDNTCGRENIVGLILNYIENVDEVDISDYRYFHRGYVNGKFI